MDISNNDWSAALHGDLQAFRHIVEPHIPELRQTSARELRYHELIRDLPENDLMPDDVVAETLIRAWETRHRRPRRLRLRAWLLGTALRIIDLMVRSEKRLYRAMDQAPEEAEDTYWDWYEPDDLEKGDMLPQDPAPVTVRLPTIREERVRSLDPRSRQAGLLSATHLLTPAEIAWILNLTVSQARHAIEQARLSPVSA
jgi:DNA-directed RNA polymerase specialized sigma24 family protein